MKTIQRKIFDPNLRLSRTSHMFESYEAPQTRDSSSVAAVAHPRDDRIGRVEDTRQVTAQPNSSNDIWVAYLCRIRDHQDETAFVEVFRHFGPRVKAFLMRSGADAAMAEECVQDVMTTVWQKSALFDPGRASVATWIFTIARNRKIDALRKQRRPEPEDLPWGPEEPPDQSVQVGLQQEREQLGEAIASLPQKQRELIEKAYFGDLSHSEIADMTGLPLGTIKSRIRLALERLRHSMDRN